MKKYVRPKIKAICLDYSQLILVVCAVSGIWFQMTFANNCLTIGGIVSTRLSANPVCSSSIRGIANPTTTNAAEDAYLPS
ncbi:MAG: hypothetical protein PHQ52_01450 [Candidatus Omnitrophica bacterium]|nr:hypothetical protein [Candidatus Omnitrophota bacterium]